MAWIYLFIAGILEVAWAYFMKESDGFSKLWPSVFTLILMVISFALLSIAMKTLPLGTSYAIWTGIGAVGAFIVGALFFGEAITVMRLVSFLFIITGLVGLKLASSH